jgi:Flp pilus assembly protein TadD
MAVAMLLALSLAAKPVAIALPLVLPILGMVRGAMRGWNRAGLGLLLATGMIATGFGLIGVWFQTHRAIGDDFIPAGSALERTQLAGHAAAHYLRTGAIPWPLAFVPPRPELSVTRVTDWWPHATALGLLALMMSRGSRTPLALAGIWLLLMAPALGFVDVYFWRYSHAQDHYQYHALPVALAGLTAIAAPVAGRRILDATRSAGLGAMVLVFAVLSFQQARIYRSEEALWTATLERNPNAWLAHGNLVRIKFASGRPDEARRHHQELRRHLEPQIRAGVEEARRMIAGGDRSGARRRLERVLELDPIDLESNRFLGILELRAGALESAGRRLALVLELEPNDARSRWLLGIIAERLGDTESADRFRRDASKLDPTLTTPAALALEGDE